MDERLHSLVNALPYLPERTDSCFEQITDLVQIAEKLGMCEAVKFLNDKLDFYRKWYGPKSLHPEQQSGEIHLYNAELKTGDQRTGRYTGWNTERVGKIAYDVDGNVQSGRVPVFVQAEEFAKSGQLTERYTIAP